MRNSGWDMAKTAEELDQEAKQHEEQGAKRTKARELLNKHRDLKSKINQKYVAYDEIEVDEGRHKIILDRRLRTPNGPKYDEALKDSVTITIRDPITDEIKYPEYTYESLFQEYSDQQFQIKYEISQLQNEAYELEKQIEDLDPLIYKQCQADKLGDEVYQLESKLHKTEYLLSISETEEQKDKYTREITGIKDRIKSVTDKQNTMRSKVTYEQAAESKAVDEHNAAVYKLKDNPPNNKEERKKASAEAEKELESMSKEYKNQFKNDPWYKIMEPKINNDGKIQMEFKNNEDAMAFYKNLAKNHPDRNFVIKDEQGKVVAEAKNGMFTRSPADEMQLGAMNPPPSIGPDLHDTKNQQPSQNQSPDLAPAASQPDPDLAPAASQPDPD